MPVLAMLAVPAAALAQAAEAPPAAQLRRSSSALAGMFAVLVLAVLVLVPALYPSKRGHQD